MALSKKTIEELKVIVGEAYVTDDRANLYIYSQDMTENKPSLPDAVIMPANVGEIRSIVLMANRHKIPLTPFVSGSNVGGLTIPVKGGIILDLKRMNRILEVNETDMHAIIEPGVTFGHIRSYLDQSYPGLRYSYPLAPPFTSVMCNALLDGLNNMGTPHGAMSEWINALEVVLPTGEIVQCGSNAVTDYWSCRVPLPDVIGLFLGWQGTTGIVTKVAVQLYPKHDYQKRTFFMIYDLGHAFHTMKTLARTLILDDVSGLSWVPAKMMFSEGMKVKKVEGEPEFYLFCEYSGTSRAELRAKGLTLSRLIRMTRDEGMEMDGPLDVDLIVKYFPEYSKLADFPTTLDFLLDYGKGGLTWVGSYGSTVRLEIAAKRCYEIMESFDFPPLIVTRIMKNGHYAALRFIITFDKKKKTEMGRARKCLVKLANVLLDNGLIPYKAPRWAAEVIFKRADPNWVNLVKRIKYTLDPNGIMNPGRWGF